MLLLVLAGCLDGKDTSARDNSHDSGEVDTDTDTGSDTDTTDTDTGGETDTHEDTDTTGDTDTGGDSDTSEVDTGIPSVEDADFVVVGADPFWLGPEHPVVADWDGDGSLDLGVSIPQATTPEGGPLDGAAWRLTDLSPGRVVLDGSATERFLGTGDSHGLTLLASVDADGDGFDDAVLDELSADGNGHVAVLRGPFSGAVTIDEGWLSLRGAADGEGLGAWSVVTGNLLGDGGPDLGAIAAGALSAPTGSFPYGGIAIFPGRESGSFTSEDASAWVACATEGACEMFARVGVLVADADGDGVDDLWVPASYADDYGGRIYLFHGPFTGERLESDADAVRFGPAGSHYGADLAVGDLDDDGLLDLVGSAASDDTYSENGGGIYVERGPIAGAEDAAERAETVLHGTEDRWFYEVDSGDLDGDGRCDLVVSANEHDYRGDLFLWTTVPTGTLEYTSGSKIVEGEDRFDEVWPKSMADVDGDGLSDPVLVFDSAVGPRDEFVLGLFYGAGL